MTSPVLIPATARPPIGRRRRALPIDRAWGAAFWYTLITLAMTWPVIRGVARDVTSDLGDPLLNCWILGWNAEIWLSFLSGNLRAFGDYWNANIYHPHPLALAYSEHLFAQGLQILPLYALTHNVVLCYNVSFLSTFVLSGLGMYLLVRELTGSARAAFVAGLIYAFVPYRIGQYPHVQVLASQWMPFSLYGFRRYFETGRIVPLAGGALALLAQNLSNGYYLMYFVPFAVLYVLYEMADRGKLLDLRSWKHVSAAGLVVIAATLPFLLPYHELRSLGNKPRHIDEVKSFSADVYAYFTTNDNNVLWGGVVKQFAKPEGELFPAFTTLALVGLFVSVHVRRRWHQAVRETPEPLWRKALLLLLGVLLISQLAASVAILFGWGGIYRVAGQTISIRGFVRAVGVSALLLGVMFALSPRIRAWLRGEPGSAVGYYMVGCVLAWYLSLGPEVTSMGRTVAPGAYRWLYEHVPGYDGLRVPARFGMIVMVFLAALAGYGLCEIERRVRRSGAALALVAALFLAESLPVPVPTNLGWGEEGLADAPARVYTGSAAPDVYEHIRRLPAGTAIAEFPFGAIGYELLAVFYASQHWKPVVNGYSGGSPPAYYERAAVLRHPLEEPALAWATLVASGATHVIVHDAVYPPADAAALNAWLQSSGAELVATFYTDRLYRLPRRAARPEPPR